MTSTNEKRRELESLDRSALELHQLSRLNGLLRAILPHNRFYAEKLAAHVDAVGGDDKNAVGPLTSLAQLATFPFTFKEELLSSGSANLGVNLTFPEEQYVRLHQTSGTRGRPLTVLDTAEDWQWWIECWQYVLDAAEIDASDRVLLAFSFGPFIGFWSAYEAAAARGCLVVPGGGMNTLSRLELLRATRATAVLCTPSYALHMAEVGLDHQIDVADLGVRALILAGEPGGSIPSVRSRIETIWHAQVLDHAGATEVGPWGYGDRQGRGLHVMESEFVAEFLSIESGLPAAEGEVAELVITNLGRVGSPVIRYRTGDLVRPVWQHDSPCRFVLLDGGVLGRADDMMIVRGVNIFPSSIEQILRSFPEIVEYRIVVHRTGQMDHLTVEIEDRLKEPSRVTEELRLRLGLKVAVRTVPVGTLPRFEGKGKRFVDQRR